MFVKLETQVINTDHVQYFNNEYLWFAYEKTYITLSEEDYKLLVTTLLPKETVVKEIEPNSELLQLFEQLHKLTGGKGKTIFSLQREKKLKELLSKHRMTKEALITAATNIGKDEFLQGKNDNNKRYGDVDYLLRPDKAAKWSYEQAEKKKGMF